MIKSTRVSLVGLVKERVTKEAPTASGAESNLPRMILRLMVASITYFSRVWRKAARLS